MEISNLEIDHSVLELLSTRAGVEFLEVLWLSEAEFQEAFQALCSILTRGKDLCSPMKRHKKRANEQYFAKLSGLNNDSPRVYDRIISGTHSTKVLRLAKGLADQSDRWSSIAVDEILSVSLLIDSASKGSVTWNEFFTFCSRIDSCLLSLSGKNTPQRSMADLYITLVSEQQSAKTNKFVNANRGNPLVDSQDSINNFTTQLIKLAIYARLNGMSPLTLLVNLKTHERMVIHRRKMEAMEDKANDVSVKAGIADTQDQGYMPIDALVSLFMHLGAEITGVDAGGVQRAKDDFQGKLAQSSAIKGSNNSNIENEINNISGIASVDNSLMLCTPDALAKKQSGVAATSGSGDLNTSIATLRENAEAISARLASQGQDVDVAVQIWSALQTLETELTKATSANTSPRTPGLKGSYSPSTPLVDLVNSNSPGGYLGYTSTSTPGSGRTSPIQVFSSPGSTMQRTLSSGIIADDQSISSTAERQASVLLERSVNGSGMATSTMRSSPIAAMTTARANMNIFKSPRSRSGVQQNAKNFFCDETMSWEGNKSNLTNKFNERFQTTNQCKDANKIFKVLGVGEVGAAKE